MTTLTEGMHEGEFIGETAMGIGYHVDEVIALSGESWAAGRVVAKVTSSGKWVAYDNASATAGINAALGISLGKVDASGGDVAKARVVTRGPMVVNGNDLGWGTNDATGITAGKADLLALGIRVA